MRVGACQSQSCLGCILGPIVGSLELLVNYLGPWGYRVEILHEC